MPTYEYICDTCNKQFEVQQSMKDDLLKKRPDCNKQCKLRQLISGGGGFRLPGIGWSGSGKPGIQKKIDKKKLKKLPPTWNR